MKNEASFIFKKIIMDIRARMIFQNKNWLAFICGETGSGKSYSALSLADMISPRGITIKRNVVFKPKQFLKKIQNREDLEKGDVLIFDEAGVGISARDWWKIQNKMLSSVLQTFREMNIGVIFTVPAMRYIDVNARILMHNYFETRSVDYKNKYAKLSIYNIQYNGKLDKIYYKHPVVLIDHKKIKCNFLWIPLPREKLIKDYEKLKVDFNMELNDDALKQIEKVEQKDKNIFDKFKEDKKIQRDIEKNYKPYLSVRAGRKYMNRDLIIDKYHISQNRADRIKRVVEKNLGFD